MRNDVKIVHAYFTLNMIVFRPNRSGLLLDLHYVNDDLSVIFRVLLKLDVKVA